MKFFNRMVGLYALVVIVLTAAYYYSAIHLFGDGGFSGVIVFVVYLALVFGSALIISQRDEVSGYAGINYHLATYLIVNFISAAMILLKSGNAERNSNMQILVSTLLVWGVGLSFHAAMYLFFFRKKQIGSYEKDDIFK